MSINLSTASHQFVMHMGSAINRNPKACHSQGFQRFQSPSVRSCWALFLLLSQLFTAHRRTSSSSMLPSFWALVHFHFTYPPGCSSFAFCRCSDVVILLHLTHGKTKNSIAQQSRARHYVSPYESLWITSIYLLSDCTFRVACWTNPTVKGLSDAFSFCNKALAVKL